MLKDCTSAEALFIKGNNHMSAGDPQNAEACFRNAIALEPDFAKAYTNLGVLLERDGRLAEAEQHYKRSITINPAAGKVHMNLGVLLARMKRFGEAETAYMHALKLIPTSALAWTNLGVLQGSRKEETKAESSYRKAIELDPKCRLAYFNLSYILLRQGRFEEGWRCLEARTLPAALDEALHCSRWRGEYLKGKSVVIGFESGYGDMIQFCRYATVLKTLGAARITIICHPELKALFTTLEGVDTVFAFDESFPHSKWDYWTPPLSLPYYCQTRLDSIPANLPYLRADNRLLEKWTHVLSKECAPSDFRVGVVWKGNARFENDTERSIPNLKMLESLGSITGVRFVSLQKGAGEDEAANPPVALPLLNLGPQISDFADSAAIVMNLDLVICVDTAIAHLAGALGKNCWVLLPHHMTDWRWLTARLDSPWYPKVMRLFRQPSEGGWETVIAEVREALQTLAVLRNS